MKDIPISNEIMEEAKRRVHEELNAHRAKVNLTVKIRTEGYGPTEHQFPEVSADIKEGCAWTFQEYDA